MTKPQRVGREEHAEALRTEPAAKASSLGLGPRAPEQAEEDIKNPLAVVIANLAVVADLLGRARVAADRAGLSPEAHDGLCANLDEADSCLRDAQAAAQRIRSAVAPTRAPRASGMRAAVDASGPRPARILIVDDDEGIGRALQRLFRDYDVVVHTSAQHAVDRMTVGERFDVVLSDVAMPGMSGCELYQQIERFAPEQAKRVIFLTGGANDDRTARFLATVGQPVLAKPFDPPELRGIIKKFVAA
jgi:CheY-like chemotaxis protein